MAKAATATQTGDTAMSADPTAKPKRNVNRGVRGAQSVYVFVKADATTGKLVITKSFRNPKKMADYFATAQEEGSQFLVTTPE
jgi:hypothetical protein